MTYSRYLFYSDHFGFPRIPLCVLTVHNYGMSSDVLRELKRFGNNTRAEFSLRYFKTGKGEYAEGDRFLGLNSGQVKQIACSYRNLSLSELEKLLESPIHEARSVSLLILVDQFQNQPSRRKEIFEFYLAHSKGINNWDLVDCSASQIVGAYLFDKSRRALHRLARSASLWDRRISIISTHFFIRKGELEETFRISKMLLADREDLMHKAVGWMLRETGKKDVVRLQSFLKTHYHKIPRTTLRYAIERFPEKERREFLTGTCIDNI
jgi:3-methyladenine DNA glycosylase AlkD